MRIEGWPPRLWVYYRWGRFLGCGWDSSQKGAVDWHQHLVNEARFGPRLHTTVSDLHL